MNRMSEHEWQKMAANHLKAEIKRLGLKYRDLQQKLLELGIEISEQALINKINRGAFQHSFFLQCMNALDIKEYKI